MRTVYRVSWLRQKDRVERWREDVKLCEVDLLCCKRWFKHQAEVWKERRKIKDSQNTSGHQCYLEKQIETWEKLELRADEAIAGTRKEASNVE